jgi:hypothetical protein
VTTEERRDLRLFPAARNRATLVADDRGATMPAQPPDEWTYLRPEEFADDDAVERVDAVFETSAEETALHVVDMDEPQNTPDGLDTGETLTRAAPGDQDGVQYFDDEEPNSTVDARGTSEGEATDEPGVDDILISQHYSFDPASNQQEG